MQAMEYLRPFLGPFYAWVSAVSVGAYLPAPKCLRVLSRFLANQLRDPSVGDVGAFCDLDPVADYAFRADARADEEVIGLGGWRPVGEDISKSPWFMVELNRKTAPWAYARGLPFREIASLELPTTLILVMILVPKSAMPSQGALRLAGDTDNRGNSYALAKMQTTSFPLCAILCELSVQCRNRGMTLDLSWVPRNQNEEADQLSNFDAAGFD